MIHGVAEHRFIVPTVMQGISNRIPIYPKLPHVNRKIDRRLIETGGPLVPGRVTRAGIAFGDNLPNLNE